MKITRIDAFQVRWTADEKPTQHSAFVHIHTDDGSTASARHHPCRVASPRSVLSSTTLLRR